MRRISVFGSTGSIGENTLDLLTPGAVSIVALTGGRQVDRLAAQARRFDADLAVTAHPECYRALKEALSGTRTEVAAGPEAVAEAADRQADWVMSAIVGAAGLLPGMRALAHGGTLALANKESLVTAGAVLMSAAARHGATILPVDSEHSAVFQALTGEDPAGVERVILTASGGPFRTWPAERMARATPAEAVAHPNWAMGRRISVDSASMFNKALELIETREFFGFDPDRIEVIVHPQSIVHALVGFRDGGLMAHLGPADMRHAIGYALNWPRRDHLPVARLDLAQLAQLTFEAPDEARFPALRLARAVMEMRGLSGAVFNAAKEVALDHFLAGGVGFADMAAIVDTVLDRLSGEMRLNTAVLTLEDVVAMDHIARRTTEDAVHHRQWQR
jgi:1-deoxy-D-xylulose-5-phosphate reductoisomerase